MEDLVEGGGGDMVKKTWKSIERRVADFFGTVRTPLSGGASRHTRSDTLQGKLFIEVKYRQVHSAVALWRKTRKLAKKEGKIPLVALAEKGKKGFWLVMHSEDLVEVAQQREMVLKKDIQENW